MRETAPHICWEPTIRAGGRVCILPADHEGPHGWEDIEIQAADVAKHVLERLADDGTVNLADIEWLCHLVLDAAGASDSTATAVSE